MEISPDDALAIPHSSGTTRHPKGVMVTHKELVASIAQKVIICFLPMFHTYAFNSLVLLAMRTGAAILIMPRDSS